MSSRSYTRYGWLALALSGAAWLAGISDVKVGVTFVIAAVFFAAGDILEALGK